MGVVNLQSESVMAATFSTEEILYLKSVRVHFAYGSDGRSFFVEYS